MADTGDRKPARSRVALTDISSRAWEHPADRGALVALRKLKGFDVAAQDHVGVFHERAVRLTLLGSAVRVDERQFARLHRLLAEVGRSLDAPDAARALRPGRPDPRRLDGRHGQADHHAVDPAWCTTSTTTSCASCSATSSGTP